MRDPNTSEYIREQLIQIVFHASIAAKNAHAAIFKEAQDEQERAFAGAVYLNVAMADMASAKAIYVSNYGELAHAEIDRVFLSFEVFADEMTQNLASDRSHQWTDFEYDSFADAYSGSRLARC